MIEELEVCFDDDPAPPRHAPQPVSGRVFRLRDYQLNWKEALKADRLTHSRLLVDAATGTGKTTFFAAVAYDEWTLFGGRTLILENRDRLVRQTAERIANETGLEAAIEMAGEHASPEAPIVVASVQTLTRDARLMGFADTHFSLIVADESHHSLANSWMKVLNYFHYGSHAIVEGWVPPVDHSYPPRAHVLGVTATPDLGAKRSLGEWYQKLTAQYQYIQAVDDGWLVPPRMENFPLKVDIRGVRTGRTPNGSDFNATDLSDRMVPIIEALAKSILERAPTRKGICFVPSIECARLLAAALTRLGLLGIFVSGECLDVDEKTELFRQSGRGTFLCNACLYVEGADFPDIDCVVPARATKSAGFYKQQIGRGTRVLPGVVDGLNTPGKRKAAIAASAKPELLILDPLWVGDRIDLCDCYDLVTDKPEVKAAMKKAGAAPTIGNAESATRDFLKALAKEARKHAKKAARTINPLEWALSLGDEKLASYVPEAAWESLPVTKYQEGFLRQHHVDLSKIKCKGLADKVITILINREKLKLASPLQLEFLHNLGVDDKTASTLSIGEAGRLITELQQTQTQRTIDDDDPLTNSKPYYRR